MFYNRRLGVGASLIVLPACYKWLCVNLEEYWILNPLRQEYKSVLYPQHLRYTDKCRDYRSADEMLAEMLEPSKDKAQETTSKRSNINMIDRS